MTPASRAAHARQPSKAAAAASPPSAAPAELRPKERNRRAEMDRLLPNTSIERVFDVGANVGQSCTWFNRVYPDAEVWAFEPVRATYDKLLEETIDLPNVRTFNAALGAKSGPVRITNQPLSVNNRIVARGSDNSEEISVTTGDEFCLEYEISRINYLKIDTEGFDLEVLRGFQGMLASFAVDVIEVEASMNWKNTKHVPFERLKGFLEPMGYMLFRLYEQVSELRAPHLRRAKLVFLSEATIEANPRAPRKAQVERRTG
jgi:FkbM family methyltransferase